MTDDHEMFCGCGRCLTNQIALTDINPVFWDEFTEEIRRADLEFSKMILSAALTTDAHPTMKGIQE